MKKTENAQKWLDLQEQVRIYKKNNKALCDLLTLVSYMQSEKEYNFKDVYFHTLAETVIKDLEDPEVNIPLKEVSYEKVLRDDIYAFYEIDHQLIDNSFNDLKENFRSDFRIYPLELIYAKNQEAYDFIKTLYEFSSEETREFLTSNIGLEKRKEFLYQVLLMSIDKGYLFDFKNLIDGKSQLLRVPQDKADEKIEVLIDGISQKINKTQESQWDLWDKLAKGNDNALNWILYLQERKIVDFMSMVNKSCLNGKVINCSPIVLFDTMWISAIQAFNELKDYLNVPEEIRNNDNIFLLNTLLLRDLSKLIMLSNFFITEEYIEIIANRILEDIDKQEGNIEEFKELIEQISNAIVHKAKNKKEYRQMLQYVSVLKELINTTYKKRWEERRQLATENLENISEHTCILHNLDKVAQESALKRIRTVVFKNNEENNLKKVK